MLVGDRARGQCTGAFEAHGLRRRPRTTTFTATCAALPAVRRLPRLRSMILAPTTTPTATTTTTSNHQPPTCSNRPLTTTSSINNIPAFVLLLSLSLSLSPSFLSPFCACPCVCALFVVRVCVFVFVCALEHVCRGHMRGRSYLFGTLAGTRNQEGKDTFVLLVVFEPL